MVLRAALVSPAPPCLSFPIGHSLQGQEEYRALVNRPDQSPSIRASGWKPSFLPLAPHKGSPSKTTTRPPQGQREAGGSSAPSLGEEAGVPCQPGLERWQTRPSHPTLGFPFLGDPAGRNTTAGAAVPPKAHWPTLAVGPTRCSVLFASLTPHEGDVYSQNPRRRFWKSFPGRQHGAGELLPVPGTQCRRREGSLPRLFVKRPVILSSLEKLRPREGKHRLEGHPAGSRASDVASDNSNRSHFTRYLMLCFF